MKKIIGVILLITCTFLITGCGCTMNDANPEEAVETFFEKYRAKDDNVLTQLRQTIESEILNDDNKVKYEELMEKQYDSLSYVIKDTSVNNNESAECIVEVTVLDYKGAIDTADAELKENPDRFNDEDGKFSDDKFMAYKIELMEKVTDTITHTINLNLTKDAGMWKVDELSKDDIKKLHGIY